MRNTLIRSIALYTIVSRFVNAVSAHCWLYITHRRQRNQWRSQDFGLMAAIAGLTREGGWGGGGGGGWGVRGGGGE